MKTTKHTLIILAFTVILLTMSATPVLAHGDEHDLEPTPIEKVISGVGVALIVGYTIYVMGIRRRPSRADSDKSTPISSTRDQDSAQI